MSLTLTSAHLGAGSGLNANQQNVATGINKFFNSGGSLTGAFAPLFALSGQSLTNSLSQLSGEVTTGAERSGLQMMTEFLGIMLDPFVDGRLGSGAGSVSGRAMGFAPDEQASLSPEVALAYVGVLKPAAAFEQRWTAGGVSYGGCQLGRGNATAGSSNLVAQTYGFAGGMDYHYSPDTIFGFALGGGCALPGASLAEWNRDERRLSDRRLRDHPRWTRVSLRGARLRQSLDDNQPRGAGGWFDGELRRPELRCTR